MVPKVGFLGRFSFTAIGKETFFGLSWTGHHESSSHSVDGAPKSIAVHQHEENTDSLSPFPREDLVFTRLQELSLDPPTAGT